MIKYAEREAAARDVVIAPSGKIIVAGYAFDNGATPKRDFAFARFNSDGSADTTLEGDGAAIKSILANETDRAYGVALQPDGKIVLSGYTTDGLDSYMVAARFNENGSFDTDTDGVDGIEFGVNGRALLTTTGGQNSKIVRQADGKFVLTGIANGGATTDCAVMRINADGSPDSSYSFDGLREIDVAGGDDRCYGIALQSDGKTVLSGESEPSGEDSKFFVARLRTDGEFDTSFGPTGRATVDIAGSIDDGAKAITVQGDGKIVAGGWVGRDNADSTTHAGLVRFVGGDGPVVTPVIPLPITLDPSFDIDGRVISDLAPGYEDNANAVVAQPDGKTISVGRFEEATVVGPFPNVLIDFVAARHNVDGSLDPSFGVGGYARITATAGSADIARAVVLQPDGKIVVAGRTTIEGAGFEFMVARLNANGSPDLTFGTDGVVYTDLQNGNTTPSGSNDIANAVSVLADGSILAAGQTSSGSSEQFAIAKYEDDGDLDTSFGGGDGIQFHDPTYGGDVIKGMVVQADGKLVVAGFSEPSGVRVATVARLDAGTGALDSTFDGDGIAELDVGGINDFANAVALQPDQKIVIAGGSDSGGSDRFFIARFATNGSLDAGFGTSGVTTSTLGISATANAVLVQQDGKIVAAGKVDYGTGNDFGFVRLLADGSLDQSFDLDGSGSTPVGTGEDEAFGLAQLPDSRVVAAGATNDGSDVDIAMVRFGSGIVPPFAGIPAGGGAPPPAAAPPVAPPVAASWSTKITYPRYNKRYKRTKFKKFSGKVSVNGASVKRMYIAVRKIDKRRCLWLRNTKAQFRKLKIKKRRCASKRWIKVKTSRSGAWSLKFKRNRKLPKGKYEVFARVVLSNGSTDTKFVKKSNYGRFTLR